MQILIIDDENLALNRLERILNEVGETGIIKTTDTNEALELIEKIKVNIIFLDINMPEINGIEFAEKILKLDNNIAIVFQTAYDNFALESYKVGGIDYILKPIQLEDVEKALSKAKKLVKTDSLQFLTKYYEQSLLVKTEDIIYIKANLTEVVIKTKEQESYLQKKISLLEQELKPYNFFRVHRSYLVNLNKVKSLITVEQSRFKIEFHDIGEVISSSRDGAKFLRDYLKK